ncbi:MAG: hypothetical protein H0W64_09010 [Gammaproteobacteria bacterium]|nr:hypothetical protein [Gammaproteobacteria bacterium]
MYPATLAPDASLNNIAPSRIGPPGLGRLNDSNHLAKPLNPSITDLLNPILTDLQNPKIDEKSLFKNIKGFEQNFGPNSLHSKIFTDELERHVIAACNLNGMDDDTIINNISGLQRELRLPHSHSPYLLNFLKQLQNISILNKTLQEPCYQNALQQIDTFKKTAQLTFLEKTFRYARAFITGLRTASIFSDWIPMIIIGVFGFLSIGFPPLFLTLLTIACTGAFLVLGSSLIYGVVKSFKNDDSRLTNEITSTENHIEDLIRYEAKLNKETYKLQDEYNHLLNQVQKLDKNFKPSTNVTSFDKNGILAEFDKFQTYNPSTNNNGIWGRTCMSFFGTMGSTWSLPITILSMIGFKFAAGASFGVAGFALAIGSIVMGGLFAVHNYFFEKKTIACQRKLHEIKIRYIGEIKQQVLNELNKNNDLKNRIEQLKTQLNIQQLQIHQAPTANNLERQINNIKETRTACVKPEPIAVPSLPRRHSAFFIKTRKEKLDKPRVIATITPVVSKRGFY